MPVVHLLILGISVGLLVSALHAVASVFRAEHLTGDIPVVAFHAALRTGASAAALWAASGGGVRAGWTFVALLVVHTVSAERAGRRSRA